MENKFKLKGRKEGRGKKERNPYKKKSGKNNYPFSGEKIGKQIQIKRKKGERRKENPYKKIL